MRSLELGSIRLAGVVEFLALLPLSQVGGSDRAIFLLAEVTCNQLFALRLAGILLDMKITAVFSIRGHRVRGGGSGISALRGVIGIELRECHGCLAPSEGRR